MIDKILLALLILMLPIGIIVSNMLYSRSEDDSSLDQEAMKKIETLLQQVSQSAKTPQAPATPKINIHTYVYDPNEQVLKVSGIAPNPSIKMLVSRIADSQLSEADPDSPVLGESVEVETVAITPAVDGTFLYQVAAPKDGGQFVEIHFQQAASSKVIIYNVLEEKLHWES